MQIRHARALMCPPSYFTVRDVKNPFMASGKPVDSARALQQWNGLRDAFARAGVETPVVDAVDDLEDMVFAANQAFVGSGARHSRFVVPSRMRYASREREVPHYTRWYAANGFTVLDLQLDGDAFLEGHGDLLPHPGSARIWAGFGFRSSRSGIERFAAAMRDERLEVIPLQLVDETFYHFDTCFAPLSAEAALYYPPAFSPEARAALEAGFQRLHPVSRDDAYTFACNGVAVNGYFVASHVSAAVDEVVRAEGLTPSIVDVSEFEKAGGSVFCMKNFLD